MLYVILLMIVGTFISINLPHAMNSASIDARGNLLPYRNETVEFDDMGPE